MKRSRFMRPASTNNHDLMWHLVNFLNPYTAFIISSYTICICYLMLSRTNRGKKYLVLQQFVTLGFMIAYVLNSKNIRMCADLRDDDAYVRAMRCCFALYSAMAILVHAYNALNAGLYNRYDSWTCSYLCILHTSMATMVSMAQTGYMSEALTCNYKEDLLFLAKWFFYTLLFSVMVTYLCDTNAVIIHGRQNWTTVATVLGTIAALIATAFLKSFKGFPGQCGMVTALGKTTLALALTSIMRLSLDMEFTGIDMRLLYTWLMDVLSL
ncbi:protein E18 [Proboscivirus elephantidbeta4]|uniref:Protein E18 n=1 Tax=Elephant endotheliotropic herpesvirus 4 TaxID=548914 RepID=A0A0S1TQX4_9BETA|nr:protein E18 [Elephant endotheliotropic herpesvirus 4]ALM25953.1 protein E18 [Elephant endotheliotropic herpesvirus 4]